MRFDWYAGSVDEGPDRVLQVLQAGQDLAEFQPFYGNKFFRSGAKLSRGPVDLAFVFWDNVSGTTNYTHFEGQSSFAPDVASRIRSAFPSHRVTRADICEDFDSPGAFDQILPFLLAIADRFKLNVDYAGDWHRLERGRTVYIGSRQSTAFIRFYEKGKQLGVKPDWVRLELQVNPRKDGREKASCLTEPEFFGCSKWSIEVGKYLQVTDLERVNVGSHHSESPELDKLRNGVKQYRNSFNWLLRQCYGDATEFGQTIVEMMHEVRAAERQRLQNPSPKNLN